MGPKNDILWACLWVLLILFSSLFPNVESIGYGDVMPEFGHNSSVALDLQLSSWWRGKQKAGVNYADISLEARGDAFVGRVSVALKTLFWVTFDSQSDILWVFDESLREDTKLAAGDEGYSRRRVFFDLQQPGMCDPSPSCELGDTFVEPCTIDSTIKGSRVKSGTTIMVGLSKTSEMPFGVVNSIHGEDSYEHLSGIDGSMGIGVGSKLSDSNKYDVPMMKMFKQHGNVWDYPAVSFYLSPLGTHGAVLFGGIEQELYVGKRVHYSPLSKKTRKTSGPEWTIDIKKVVYGGLVLKGTVAVIATRAPVLALPSPLFQQIDVDSKMDFNCDPSVNPTNRCFASCDAVEDMPDLEFLIYRKKYSLSPSDYSKEVERHQFDPENYRRCELAIQDSRSETEFTFGHPFLKKYYTVFYFGSKKSTGAKEGKKERWEKPKIGFAPAMAY